MRKIIAIFVAIILNANFAYADLITENIPNGCNFVNGAPDLFAFFELNTHTCSAGYYLPANTDGCVACLSGHTCDGGTFSFNETIDQGIVVTYPITTTVTNGCDNYQHLFAVFEPNTHTCDAGYYMPANTDGCVICPADSYCAGGTYTFNETAAQGITACAAGLYAPTGMASATQCGHILHIGNDIVYLHSVKKTTPSLHAKVGDTVFYGNMTTADVPMHAGSERKLKVTFNGTIYSIYDDTVTVP